VATTKFIYNVLGTTPEFINSVNNLNKAVLDASDNFMSALVSMYAPVSALRDAPDAPAVPLVNSAVSTSTYILLKFTPNEQYNWGFTDVPLPRINDFSAQYDRNVNNVSTLTDILPTSSQKTTYTNPTTINACGFIRNKPSDTVCSGICLVKAFPSRVFGVNIIASGINLINDGTDSRYYYCTNVAQSDLFPDDSNGNPVNKIHIWYSNYYPSVNKTDIKFKIYISSGPPSDPLYFVQTTSTTPNDTTSTWTTGTAWNDPSYNDANNITSTVGLSSYQVTYLVDPSNVPLDPEWSSHNPSYAPSAITVNASNGNPPAKTADLPVYPSTSYIAYVQAKNTDNASYGAQSNPISFRTADLSPNITTLPSDITFSTTGWTSKTDVKDLTNTTRSIYMSKTSPVTSAITTPIQNSTDLIASTAQNIRNIVSTLTNNSIVVADSSSTPLSYGGFGQSPPSAVTGDLALENSSISDQFILDGQKYYYQKASFTGTINAGILSSTGSPYTYTYQINDASLSAVGNTSISFLYEPVQSSDVSATGITYTGPTLSELSLWGLKIVNSDISLNTTISGIANIGNYFYSSGNFITYSSESSTGLSSALANLPASAIDTDVTPNKIKSSFDVENTVVYPVPTAYTKSHTITAVVNGIISNRSVSVTSIAFSALCDPLTNSFFSTLPTGNTLSVLSSTLSVGSMLAPLASTDTTFLGTTTYSSGGVSLADATNLYNFGNSLTTAPYTNALLFASGGFVTPSTYDNTSPLYPYINYNGIGSNTLDYRTTAFGNGIRSVMMAWKLPNQRSTGGSFVKIDVTLDFTDTTITPQGEVNGYEIKLDDKFNSLQIAYRLEDASDTVNPTSSGNTSFDPNKFSTIWIRANSNGGITSPASSLNCFGTTNDINGKIGPIYTTTNSISYGLFMPTLTQPDKDIKFIFRVCIPSNVAMKLTNIRAKITPA